MMTLTRLIPWVALIFFQSVLVAGDGFDQPYLLLPPPLITEAQGWFVKGQFSDVPFSSYFFVSPVFDENGTLEASSSWQNMTFLGFTSLDVTFEGLSYVSDYHYAQAASASNASNACYSFDEIVQCTGWALIIATASPFYPLNVWQNNCSIVRVCGQALVSGFMNISITSDANDDTDLHSMIPKVTPTMLSFLVGVYRLIDW